MCLEICRELWYTGQKDERQTPMKILVLSDSHSALSFMRHCIEKVKPDTIIHLGDHYDDGEAMAEEYPHIPLIQVPGNCDRYRCPPDAQEILMPRLGGVRLYLTHGHRHWVKKDTAYLISEAKKCGAGAVLYGHTHVQNCYQDQEGFWILNPGSCGYFGGSAGLMEIENGKIQNCRILKAEDFQD